MKLINKIQFRTSEFFRYIFVFGIVRGSFYFSLCLIIQGDTEIIKPALLKRARGMRIFLRLRSSDIQTFIEVFKKLEYQVPKNLSNPQTIVDVGANAGFTTALFANLFPEAKIISIEPEKSNYSLLLTNTKNLNNVHPINAALWSECGKIDLFTNGSGHWGYLTNANTIDPGISKIGDTDAIYMECLMKKYGIESLDILKVDVEGAEKTIFEGKPSWAEQIKFLAIELHDRIMAGCQDSVENSVQHLKFRWKIENTNYYSINPS